MRYIVRQKIFTIGDKFTIKDEQDSDIYLVKRQFLSVGKKLRIYDMSENELCYIEQKLFKFMPEYHIFRNGELQAVVKKKFAFLKHIFLISASDSEYTVSGNMWGYEFSIKKEESIIATISKKFFSVADTYSVDIDDSQDQLKILSMVIVIDMVLHDAQNKGTR